MAIPDVEICMVVACSPYGCKFIRQMVSASMVQEVGSLKG